MTLPFKAATAAIALTLLGAGGALAGEAMKCCCKDMKEKMACCDEKKAAPDQKPAEKPAPEHKHHG
jgi:hypothetical protein